MKQFCVTRNIFWHASHPMHLHFHKKPQNSIQIKNKQTNNISLKCHKNNTKLITIISRVQYLDESFAPPSLLPSFLFPWLQLDALVLLFDTSLSSASLSMEVFSLFAVLLVLLLVVFKFSLLLLLLLFLLFLLLLNPNRLSSTWSSEKNVVDSKFVFDFLLLFEWNYYNWNVLIDPSSFNTGDNTIQYNTIPSNTI